MKIRIRNVVTTFSASRSEETPVEWTIDEEWLEDPTLWDNVKKNEEITLLKKNNNKKRKKSGNQKKAAKEKLIPKLCKDEENVPHTVCKGEQKSASSEDEKCGLDGLNVSNDGKGSISTFEISEEPDKKSIKIDTEEMNSDEVFKSEKEHQLLSGEETLSSSKNSSELENPGETDPTIKKSVNEDIFKNDVICNRLDDENLLKVDPVCDKLNVV